MSARMSRVFAYCRVSTADQTTSNQVAEIRAAGFDLKDSRAICETVSGSQAATLRPGFAKLLDKLESGDVLVVTKLDRLGRSAQDVAATVAKLEAAGVRVHCLALGGADLTSAAGKMVMQVLGAVAEFELDLIKERTLAGLARAKKEGKLLGRPTLLAPDQAAAIKARVGQPGETVAGLAREFKVSRATVMRAAGVMGA